MSRSCPRLLHDSLRIAAAEHPDKAAVVTEDERLSYRELAERSARLARGLQDRGVRRGDRVAIYLENSADLVAAIYGTLMSGAAFMVVNPQTKADKLAYVLSDAQAAAIVAEGHLAKAVAEAAATVPSLHTVVLRGATRETVQETLPLDAFLADHPPEPHDSGVLPVDLAALISTSGSTDNPKGVMLSHQNMVFTQASVSEYLRLSTDDRILHVLPLAFDYGLYQAIMAIHLAATLVLETSFSFPARVIQRVNEEGVTVFPGVPTVFATLLSLHRDKPQRMPSVRRYTNTAAHLPDDHVPGLLEMSPDALVFKMYGLTECKRVCYLEPELIDEKTGSVGKAIPGTEVLLLSADGNPVLPNEPGILHVRGPHVMSGYWNNEELSKQMLKPGPVPGEK